MIAAVPALTYCDLFSNDNFGIYNRWRQLIFTSHFPGQGWDGYTQAGQPASEGTYFYVLKAKSAIQDYSSTGHVTLVRGK